MNSLYNISKKAIIRVKDGIQWYIYSFINLNEKLEGLSQRIQTIEKETKSKLDDKYIEDLNLIHRKGYHDAANLKKSYCLI